MYKRQLPDEETQFSAYREVLKGFRGKPVIIRTLDIGADKQLPYFSLPEEANPALGKRAIRYCLSNKELFRTQLRALLRNNSLLERQYRIARFPKDVYKRQGQSRGVVRAPQRSHLPAVRAVLELYEGLLRR